MAELQENELMADIKPLNNDNKRWFQNLNEEEISGLRLERFQKNIQKVPPEEIERLKFQRELDRRQNIDDATFGEKLKAAGEVFGESTFWGTLFLPWVVNDDDFEADEKLDRDMVFDIARQYTAELGLNDRESQDLYNAKSMEHFGALVNSYIEKRDKQEFVNNTLSSSAQIFTSIASVPVDLDTILSLASVPLTGGATAARVAAKVGSNINKLRWGTGAGLGALASWNLVRKEELFKEGLSNNDLLKQSALFFAFEAGFGRALTFKNQQRKLAGELGKKDANDAISKNYINQNVTANSGDMLLNVDKRTTSAISRFSKDAGLDKNALLAESQVYKQTFRNVQESLNVIDDSFRLAMEESKGGLKAGATEVEKFSKATINELVNTKVLTKQEANALQKGIDESVKASKAGKSAELAKVNKAKNEKILQTAKQLKKDPTLLKPHGLYKPIEKVQEKVQALTTKLKEVIKGESEKVELQKKIEKLQDKLQKNTEKLSRATKDSNRAALKEANAKIKSEIKNFEKTIRKIDKLENNLKVANQNLEETTASQIQKFIDKNAKDGIVLHYDKAKKAFTWKGKIIPAGLVLGAIGSVDAMAGDDDITGAKILSGWQGLLVMGLAGALGYKAIKSIKPHYKSVVEPARKQAGIVAENMSRMDTIKEALKGQYLWLRTGLTETYSPAMKYAIKKDNKELMKFIDDLLVNPVLGKAEVVESMATRNFRTTIGKYVKAENELFEGWLKETGVGLKGQALDKIFGHKLNEFRELVSGAIDGVVDISSIKGGSFVGKMAKESRRTIEEALEFAKEVGLEGTEEMARIENYLRRAYSPRGLDRLRDIMKGANSLMADGSKAKDTLVKTFTKMHLAAVGYLPQEAAGLVSHVTKAKNQSEILDILGGIKKPLERIAKEDENLKAFLDITRRETKDLEMYKEHVKDMLTYVEGMGDLKKVNKKITEYLEDITNFDKGGAAADIASPLKSRVPLDLRAFESFTYNNGVEDVAVNLNSIFERNNYNLMASYTRQLYGRSALKYMNYSVEGAKRIIDSVTDKDIHGMMSRALDAILGRPMFETTKYETAIINTTSNVAYAMQLPLVGFSFAQEIGYMLAKGARNPNKFFRAINEATSIIKNHGKDSAMVQMIQDRLGRGVGSLSMDRVGSRFDASGMLANGLTVGGEGGIEQVSRAFRDFVMKRSGMMFLSDFLEVQNTVFSMDKLYRVANGLETMSKFQRETFGITDDILDIAKKHLKLNKESQVKALDYSNMTLREKTKLNGTINNMVQKGAQQSTIGGSSDFSRRNALGVVLTKLLSYPMNAFSNMGVYQMRALAHGDIEGISTMFAGFVGSMIGMKLRDSIRGVEKREEDYIKFGLLNIAIMNPLGTFWNFNPVMLKPIEKASNMAIDAGKLLGESR